MKNETFQELLFSLKQGGAILHGDMSSSQVFIVVKQDKQEKFDVFSKCDKGNMKTME